MDVFDLVQAIDQFYNDGTKTTIEAINDLIQEITDNPDKLIVALSEIIEDIAKNSSLCPVCGNDLVVVDKYGEEIGEYFGRPVTQSIKKYGCKSCDYIEE